MTLVQTIDAITKIVTGIAGVTISYLLFRINSINQRRLTRQHHMERQLSLDIEMTTTLSRPNDQSYIILNIKIDTKNISKERWCIPAVFVSIRSLTSGTGPSIFVESDFQNLQPCNSVPGYESVDCIPNLARVSNSIKHLSPDEMETVTCTVLLSEAFVQAYPVIVVQSRIFAAGSRLLGPKFLKGNMRNEWIDFMQENDGDRNRYCFLERLPILDTGPSVASTDLILEPGKWCIVNNLRDDKGISVPDNEHTRRFKLILETVERWHRFSTLDLRIPAENG